jgi:hypothetical protein
MHAGPRAFSTYRPSVSAALCACLLIGIQIAFHHESITGDGVRPFIIWTLLLIVTQSLSWRPGFLHRFACVTFVIGVASLRYLVRGSGSERAGLAGSTAIDNPNDLAAWFGFCALYFLVLGIETKRGVIRAAAWLATAGCFGVVGLTVSRGTLLGVGIASVIPLRRVLKRGVAPLLALISVVSLAYVSGIYAGIVSSYVARGLEETGRLLVWPLDLKRIIESPLIGVGVSDVATYVPEAHKAITPHNGFLYIALASGIVPLIFFVTWWWQAARSAVDAMKTSDSLRYEAALLVYCFVVIQSGAFTFTAPWVVATLCAMRRGFEIHYRSRRRLYRGSEPGDGGRFRSTQVRPIVAPNW